MITDGTSCYVYKTRKLDGVKLYKRARPDNKEVTEIDRWNTIDKNLAGMLTKAQWQERFLKWAYKDGYTLEAINGEQEVLQC